MDARWVICEETKQRIGAYCGKCGMLWTNKAFGGGDRGLDEAHRMAEKCCRPNKCERCGKECEKHYVICSECRVAKDAEQEHQRFEKAEKITYAAWLSGNEGDNAMIYAPDFGNGFFSFLDELADHIECWGDDDLEPPYYVWPTRPQKMRFDSCSLIEDATQDMHEEAAEEVSVEAGEELQAMLDQWCADHPVTSYFPYFDQVIVLTDEERASLVPKREDD